MLKNKTNLYLLQTGLFLWFIKNEDVKLDALILFAMLVVLFFISKETYKEYKNSKNSKK